MKNYIKTLALLGALAPEVAIAATATGTGHISAKIVNPVTITETQALNFGTITNEAGFMGVSPTGARYTYGNNLVTDGSPVSPAQFTITGPNNQAITISMPASGVTISSGNTSIPIQLWSTDLQWNDGTWVTNKVLNSSGSLTISIGGEMDPQNAPEGDYTGTYAVTVDY